MSLLIAASGGRIRRAHRAVNGRATDLQAIDVPRVDLARLIAAGLLDRVGRRPIPPARPSGLGT